MLLLSVNWLLLLGPYFRQLLMRVLGIVLFHRSSMHPTLVVPRLFLCQNLRPPLFIRRANPLIVMPSIDEPLRADPIGAVSENGREVVLGVEALLGSGTDGVVVASGQGSVAAIIILSGPSTSQQAHTSSLASERLKGVVVNDYESDSDIDPEDMRLFEKSFTRVDMRAGGPSRVLEISSNFNLLENTVDLVEQFDLLCSAVESRFLREISDSGLSRGVAGMALRVSFFVFTSFILCPSFSLILFFFCFRLTCWRLKVLHGPRREPKSF